MNDEIYFTCKKHGQLTRKQVYSHKRKDGPQKWQCKTCNDNTRYNNKHKKLNQQLKKDKKNLIPNVILKNITLESDNAIATKKAAIHLASFIKINRRMK